MSRKNKRASARSTAKKKKAPLTERVDLDLKKHGASTSDAVARRLRVRAPAVVKALSHRKRQGKAYFTFRNGENYWRRGKQRQR